MRALLSHEPGGPDSLRLDEVPDPKAGPGELLVRVRAAAINYPDVLIIEDRYQLKPPRPRPLAIEPRQAVHPFHFATSAIATAAMTKR